MVLEAGIRHNSQWHIGYQLDTESGDMIITLEIKDNDGNIQVVTGTVAWDE